MQALYFRYTHFCQGCFYRMRSFNQLKQSHNFLCIGVWVEIEFGYLVEDFFYLACQVFLTSFKARYFFVHSLIAYGVTDRCGVLIKFLKPNRAKLNNPFGRQIYALGTHIDLLLRQIWIIETFIPTNCRNARTQQLSIYLISSKLKASFFILCTPIKSWRVKLKYST